MIFDRRDILKVGLGAASVLPVGSDATAGPATPPAAVKTGPSGMSSATRGMYRMPTSAIDSLIFRDLFGSPEMRRIWSDEYRTQMYLDWEAALPGRRRRSGSSRRRRRTRSPGSARSRTSTSPATPRRR